MKYIKSKTIDLAGIKEKILYFKSTSTPSPFVKPAPGVLASVLSMEKCESMESLVVYTVGPVTVQVSVRLWGL